MSPYNGPYIDQPCGDDSPHDQHVYYDSAWYRCKGVRMEVD